MAVLLVTYDLKQPGRNYTPVHEWLQKFKHCKKMESVWLLDTDWTPVQVRDNLSKLVDQNDVIFVCTLTRAWAARNYECSEWLKDATRRW